MITFKNGDLVRENRQLAETEKVFEQIETTITMYSGRVYHITKIVKI